MSCVYVSYYDSKIGYRVKAPLCRLRTRLTCVVSKMIVLFSMYQKACSTILIVGWVSARFEILSTVLLKIQILWDMKMCQWVRLGSQCLKDCVTFIMKVDKSMKDTQHWLLYID